MSILSLLLLSMVLLTAAGSICDTEKVPEKPPIVYINGKPVKDGETFKSPLIMTTDVDYVICEVGGVDNITLTCGTFSETNKNGKFKLTHMKLTMCSCSANHSSGCYTKNTTFWIETSNILTFTANKIGYSINVTLGEKVLFECSSDGHVYDTMFISNMTSNVTSGNNINQITHQFVAKPQSVGTYQCTAYAKNISAYQRVKVEIKRSPATIISFTANGRHGNQEFQSGNIVDFRCDTQGFPIPDITVQDKTSGQNLPQDKNSSDLSVIVRKKLECHPHLEAQIFECIAGGNDIGTPPAKSSVELKVRCTNGAVQQVVIPVLILCFITLTAVVGMLF